MKHISQELSSPTQDKILILVSKNFRKESGTLKSDKLQNIGIHLLYIPIPPPGVPSIYPEYHNPNTHCNKNMKLTSYEVSFEQLKSALMYI
jgi:hypothetical protein